MMIMMMIHGLMNHWGLFCVSLSFISVRSTRLVILANSCLSTWICSLYSIYNEQITQPESNEIEKKDQMNLRDCELWLLMFLCLMMVILQYIFRIFLVHFNFVYFWVMELFHSTQLSCVVLYRVTLMKIMMDVYFMHSFYFKCMINTSFIYYFSQWKIFSHLILWKKRLAQKLAKDWLVVPAHHYYLY